MRSDECQVTVMRRANLKKCVLEGGWSVGTNHVQRNGIQPVPGGGARGQRSRRIESPVGRACTPPPAPNPKPPPCPARQPHHSHLHTSHALFAPFPHLLLTQTRHQERKSPSHRRRGHALSIAAAAEGSCSSVRSSASAARTTGLAQQ